MKVIRSIEVPFDQYHDMVMIQSVDGPGHHLINDYYDATISQMILDMMMMKLFTPARPAS